eukprot:365594-Chlamydomonas_euryale.AAC.12
MSAAPGLSQSPLMSSGWPAAAITMSACRTACACARMGGRGRGRGWIEAKEDTRRQVAQLAWRTSRGARLRGVAGGRCAGS